MYTGSTSDLQHLCTSDSPWPFPASCSVCCESPVGRNGQAIAATRLRVRAGRTQAGVACNGGTGLEQLAEVQSPLVLHGRVQ